MRIYGKTDIPGFGAGVPITEKGAVFIACKLIDVHYYGRYEKRPKIPQEPLCLPAEFHNKLILIKTALITTMFAILLGFCFFLNSPPESGAEARNPQPAAQQERHSKRGFPFSIFFMSAALLGVTVYGIVKIEKKMYARLQNPVFNPRGCKYQGRVLSVHEPHYQLHLNYYKANNSWTLPDELEHGDE